jgi:hypothetical protein
VFSAPFVGGLLFARIRNHDLLALILVWLALGIGVAVGIELDDSVTASVMGGFAAVGVAVLVWRLTDFFYPAGPPAFVAVALSKLVSA